MIPISNAKKIWDFLKLKGFNDYACAGIIGNFDCESGLNPKNLQDSCQAKLGFTDESYVFAIDNGTYSREQFSTDGAGAFLAQWTWHTRKRNLYDFVKSRGASIGDLEAQLEFFYKELSESFPSVLHALMHAASVREASDIMLLKYERPADMSAATQIKRTSFGQKYYAEFANDTGKGGTHNMGYLYFTKGKSVKVSAHFNSSEFDCHGNGCCTQTIVNEKLVEYLEKIRNHFNAPITISSPYRCPTHNSRIGGAVGSRHSKGDACDIVVKGVAPRKVAQYAESIGIKGVGLYETGKDGYFVHIDTRTSKSFWYGQAEQPRTTFGTYTNTTASSGGSASNSVLDTILNLGDSGSAVRVLQEKLITLGYGCGEFGADGQFGSSTESAVRKFQEDAGISIDGIAGSQTLIAIDKSIADLNAAETSGKSVKITANVLNVRSGAGMNYPVIGYVRKNTVCTIIGEVDDWGKIKSPAGWISKQYYEAI